MKKIVILLLMFVYSMSTSGMTVYLHYCCGKLDKIQVAASEKPHCEPVEDCGNQQKCDSYSDLGHAKCCFDQSVALKISAEQEPLLLSKNCIQPIHLVPTAIVVVTPQLAAQDVQPYTIVSAQYNLSPLHIRNCVFRI